MEFINHQDRAACGISFTPRVLSLSQSCRFSCECKENKSHGRCPIGCVPAGLCSLLDRAWDSKVLQHGEPNTLSNVQMRIQSNGTLLWDARHVWVRQRQGVVHWHRTVMINDLFGYLMTFNHFLRLLLKLIYFSVLLSIIPWRCIKQRNVTTIHSTSIQKSFTLRPLITFCMHSSFSALMPHATPYHLLDFIILIIFLRI
jgi:hypothetical protein